MLGPIVALLLLTAPAGPVNQLCWSLNADAQRTCERQNQLERRIEQLEQPTYRLPSIVPDYTTPSRPSLSFPDSSSTTSTRCALC